MTIGDLPYDIQKIMCRDCEIYFFDGQSHMSQHFMCEGCKCEEAFELLQDLHPEFFREVKLNRILK